METFCTTGIGTVFPSKSKACFVGMSKWKDSGNPNNLRPSLLVNFLIPWPSTTARRSISVATRVGAISLGSKILLISKLSFPVTILYPFGKSFLGNLFLTIFPSLFFTSNSSLGCSYFK